MPLCSEKNLLNSIKKPDIIIVVRFFPNSLCVFCLLLKSGVCAWILNDIACRIRTTDVHMAANETLWASFSALVQQGKAGDLDGGKVDDFSLQLSAVRARNMIITGPL